MGLVGKLAIVLIDKAKEELEEYVKKVVESSRDNAEEASQQPVDPEVVSLQPEAEPDESSEHSFEPEDVISRIIPLVNDLPIKYHFTTTEVPLSKDFNDLTLSLPFDEFAIYTKLFIYSVAQRKNYGYLGNSLRRKTGLDSMDNRLFELALLKLSARGLIAIEDLSSNQRTFVLYVPFDEDYMKKQEKRSNKQDKRRDKQSSRSGDQRQQRRSNQRQNSPQQSDNRSSRSRKGRSGKAIAGSDSVREESVPGRADHSMDDEELKKQYNTFVSLEIDKAKMRVGRSNFDKIYMEAVKYIDKKYGFKVLSDTEKFKEYLTGYYMSAFDIPSFDEWKNRKNS